LSISSGTQGPGAVYQASAQSKLIRHSNKTSLQTAHIVA